MCSWPDSMTSVLLKAYVSDGSGPVIFSVVNHSLRPSWHTDPSTSNIVHTPPKDWSSIAHSISTLNKLHFQVLWEYCSQQAARSHMPAWDPVYNPGTFLSAETALFDRLQHYIIPFYGCKKGHCTIHLNHTAAFDTVNHATSPSACVFELHITTLKMLSQDWLHWAVVQHAHASWIESLIVTVNVLLFLHYSLANHLIASNN